MQCLLVAGAFVFSCWMVVGCVGTIQDGIDSFGWPRAPARILVSEVVTPKPISRKKAPEPYTRLQYEYTHEGVTYPGWRVGQAGHALGAAGATRYPVGATPEVWVDPSHPELAVLEPGVNSSDVLVLLFSLGMSIASGIWLVHRAFKVYEQRRLIGP